MLITKEIEIDMAHRVPNHKSKCRNLHGHRYKIEVGVNDKIIEEEWRSDQWMVIDFGDLKEIMIDYIDRDFDHWAVFYENDIYRENIEQMVDLESRDPRKLHFVEFIPTAENLCKLWFWLIEQPLKDKWIQIHHLKIWETPTSTAIYTIQEKEDEEYNKIEQKRLEDIEEEKRRNDDFSIEDIPF